MSELNLYQRLGGENVVNVLVENVYDKIRDDYRVSRFFNDTDQKNQIQTLNVVVSTALNGNFNTNEFIKSVSDFFMSAFAK
ncbi:MAG: Bacterial-like globin, partial [Pseudomonadota bacterium]